VRLRGARATCVCTMAMMIHSAYGITSRHIVGPSWLTLMGPGGLYELIADPPHGATESDIPAMMRSLLADRFHFSGHWEKRKTAVYALQVESSGLRLKPHQPSPDDDKVWVLKHPVGDAADPQMPPMKAPHLQFFEDFRTGRLHVEGFGTFAELAVGLRGYLDRSVVDQTGVDGAFDITLDAITPEPLGALAIPIAGDAAPQPYRRSDPSGDLILLDGRHLPGMAPPLLTEIKRLGLHLTPTSAMLDYLVVDRVERIPSAN